MNKQKGGKTSKEDARFKTDSDISKSKYRERELTKWVPEADDGVTAPVLEFDESSAGKGTWDQFQVNKEKFGVESTYDEHLYTTRINTEAKDYNERLKKAEQLAKEIENDVTSDPHILEERGKIVDSMDEEMKYSGVVRDEEEGKKDTRGDELMAALKSMNVKSPSPSTGGGAINNDPAIASVDKKHSESFRLNAQSEINSLKEFSAKFKVPHKLPNDLLPILAKDKNKQDEILKKSSSQESSQHSTPQHQHQPPQTQTQAPTHRQSTSSTDKPKRTDSKFKLNPKAASFTPSFAPAATSASSSGRSNQISPQQQAPPKLFNGSNSRSPNNPSPRMNNNQRPYSSGSSSSNKRHYQISPSDFFGPNAVPTKESQVEKANKFKKSFSLFMTIKANTKKGEEILVDRAYVTPPTWDQTVDESHTALFPTVDKAPSMAPPYMMMMPMMNMPPTPFSPPSSDGSPIPAQMQMPVSPNMAFPPQQTPQQQQQQFAMMYQQQQFRMVPPPMYIPGQEYMPNYMQGGYYNGNGNGNGNGRRYSKRNSNY